LAKSKAEKLIRIAIYHRLHEPLWQGSNSNAFAVNEILLPRAREEITPAGAPLKFSAQQGCDSDRSAVDGAPANR
jgi:hypothetical protein